MDRNSQKPPTRTPRTTMRSRLVATFLLLLVAAATTSDAKGTGAASSSCLPNEREALLAFKRGITGDPAAALPHGTKETKTAADGEASGAVTRLATSW